MFKTKSIICGLLLFFLVACGNSASHQASRDISFPLPSALTKAASSGTMTATLIASNGIDTQSADMTISGGTVSGSITLAEGTWEFQLIFYITADSGNKLAVAFVLFGEVTISGDTWTLTFGDSDLLDELTSDQISGITPSISVAGGCEPIYDCDGDGYTNLEEFDADSDPENATSFPGATVCGNGTKETGEECDDGNTTDGDGCDSSCKTEVTPCGDGTVESGEECDDENTTDGDGCNSSCKTEVCGNGTVDANEGCDDGNTTSGDGCNSSCKGEACGDGTVDAYDQCDDGNTTSGDGCSSLCKTEVCGNSAIEGGEECDDGNTTNGDGCSSSCVSEVITITVNLTDGETVQDAKNVLADATTTTGTIRRLIVSKSSGNTLSDTNGASDAFDATWDTASDSVTEDSSVTFTFTTQDTSGNSATKSVTVVVDNTPNITSFGTSALIQDGGSASLSWTVGNYSSLSIDNNVGTLSGDSGSKSVSPTTTTTYTLTATRNGTSKTFTATKTVTISVNHQPTVNVPDSAGTLLGNDIGYDPAGISLSWTPTDQDGDSLTSTVTIYKGTGCIGEEVATQPASTTGSSVSVSLDPRTDYSYEVVVGDGNGGTSNTSTCQNFTTSDTGLVGWWRMDGDVTDSSGKGRDGVLANDSNPSPYAFSSSSVPSDQALRLDGTANHYVSNGNYNDFDFGTGDYALELWVNVQDDYRAQLFISNGTYSGYEFMYGTGGQVYLNSADSGESIVAPEISPNAWHHVVATRENSEVRIYIDGSLQGSGINDDNFATDNGRLFLGADWDTAKNLNGLMDEVAIYKGRALTTQEIRDFCQRGEASAGITCADDDVPAQLTPSNMTTLPPTRAFLSWEAGTVPTGKTFDHYALCYSSSVDLDFFDCETDKFINITDLNQTYYVVEDLSISSTYEWELRTCYNAAGTDCSGYTPVWSFSTDNSLVGWWKFDETSGTTASDSSGNGHDGTLYEVYDLDLSPGWTTGGFLGGAIDFSNTSEYVRVLEPLSDQNIYNPFTVSAWVNMSGFSTSQTWEPVVYAEETQAFLGYLSSDTTNPNASPYPAFGGETDVWLVSGTADSALLNTWHYLTGTYDYDTTTGSLFVDGSVVQSDSEATNAFWSGSGNHGNFKFRSMNNSLIDEVALYNKALSEEEILNSYCAIEALVGTNPLPDGCL